MSTVFAFLNVQSWFEFWWVAFGLGGPIDVLRPVYRAVDRF